MSIWKDLTGALLPPASEMRQPDHSPDVQQRHELRRGDASATVLAYLVAGTATFGGIGYGVDRWLDTSIATPIGILGGVALALYTVYLRFGRT